MTGIELAAIEGIATFLVLIIRYVEGIVDSVFYVRSLIKGDYHITSGGELEREGHSAEAEINNPPVLPFSLDAILRTFINSVIDTDADSLQHRTALAWISLLTDIVGSSKFMRDATTHSRDEYQRLLWQLLGRQSRSDESPTNRFDTLSAACAMIALAARANGADVYVECRTSGGSIPIPADSQLSRPSECLLVVLWLHDPPETVTKLWQGRQPGPGTPFGTPSDILSVPIFGGAAEISSILAKQMQCNFASNIALKIWNSAVAAGEDVTWLGGSSFRIDEHSIRFSAPAQIAQIADKIYTRDDFRYPLSRMAATIYHDIFDYSDYRSLQEQEVKRAFDFIWTAFTVGTLRKLISNRSDRLSQYAWTIDCSSLGTTMTFDHPISFLGDMISNGVATEQILWQAACIWGGSTHKAHNMMMVHDRTLGIVSPHATILLNIIRNPKEVAEFGVSKGILSIHFGSVPTLPRDPKSNMVVAGNPRGDAPFRSVSHRNVRKLTTEAKDDILLSVEPYNQADGTLTAIICAWRYGEVALEMDPSHLFANLFGKRGLNALRSTNAPKLNQNIGILPLRLPELLDLGQFTVSFMGSAVVNACNRYD
jgi:hypothetical protein